MRSPPTGIDIAETARVLPHVEIPIAQRQRRQLRWRRGADGVCRIPEERRATVRHVLTVLAAIPHPTAARL